MEYVGKVTPSGETPRVDFLFSGEDYGKRLADCVHATWVPFPRDDFSPYLVCAGASWCATKFRHDPVRFWDRIPAVARPYFVRRVCITGPESCGKSTLARELAKQFGTVCCEEYARSFIELSRGNDLSALVAPEDYVLFARGHMHAEWALAGQARRGLMFTDTDVITTTVYLEALGESGAGTNSKSQAALDQQERDVQWLRQAATAHARSYDLYLLLDVDCPFQPDPQRALAHQRASLFATFQRALQQALDRAYSPETTPESLMGGIEGTIPLWYVPTSRPCPGGMPAGWMRPWRQAAPRVVVISGSAWPDRVQKAVRAVREAFPEVAEDGAS
ncbi:putative DNA-binding transcriptional repressor/NMN adenylyltransferase NadR [Paratrimastix pyriformis]|uniref:DNA-binding transcriptional repressor/NMN adenylyltransferase NadR n=1 Tax=Paratrimastix pyriformis TaxID=342808 RepID=A0ABQ9YMN1_9EUKA|nr:putative DNA-binding transcriptional repressor/NMN adenylyltransferase NadR [Paratrimastix pyriformis]